MADRYVCTWVEKTRERDGPEGGCGPGGRELVFDERRDVSAPTLRGLLDRLGAEYGIAIGEVFYGGHGHMDYNRVETAGGSEPDKVELELWRAGKMPLYLADYHFHVERRVASDLTERDLEEAGIRHH